MRPGSNRSARRPAYEAELAAGPRAVAAEGVVAGAADGTGTEDGDVRDSGRAEEQRDRQPEIHVASRGALVPGGRGQVARARAEGLAHLRSDLVAAASNAWPDRRLDLGRYRPVECGDLGYGHL